MTARAPRVAFVVLHASFDEDRRQRLERLLGQLREEVDMAAVEIVADDARAGCLATWRRAVAAPRLERLEQRGFTHLCLLADDDVLCPGFRPSFDALVERFPADVLELLSFADSPARPEDRQVLSSLDGFAYHGGTMPLPLVREATEWRSRALRPAFEREAAPDLGVVLWAVATGRRFLKPALSLVEHEDGDRSLVGNGKEPTTEHGRRALRTRGAPDGILRFRAPEPEDDVYGLGRLTRGAHRLLLAGLRPELVTSEIVEAAYLVERHGAPVSALPTLMAAQATGDSSEERSLERAYGVHRFLASNQTHLLFDHEPHDPDAGAFTWTREQVTARLAATVAKAGIVQRLAGEVPGDPEALGAPVWPTLDWTGRSS